MSRLCSDSTTDFPILCQDCLGDNPYLRMSKEIDGKDCKICSRPFTLFKWSISIDERKKKTEICTLCAKLKNVCQCCILDLDYKLPASVRDSVLGNKVPNSNVNTEYYVNNMAKQESFKADSAAKDVLKSFSTQSSLGSAKSSRKVCSFFQKGECTKGDKCPFRHELDLSSYKNKSVKEKYHGKEIIAQSQKIIYEAPQDKSIKTIYIKDVDPEITEADIREELYAFGEIESLVILRRAKCAFLTFGSRISAELAVETCINNLEIKGHSLKVQWGKSKNQKSVKSHSSLPPPPLASINHFGSSTGSSLGAPPPPPGSGSGILYPSMDPRMLGTATETYGKDDF